MLDFFRAHRAVGMAVPSYFIESTAPENVDDRAVVPTPLPPELEEVDPDAAVKQIAAALASGTVPNLVVMVHGFNNPEPAVLRMYAAAAQAIERDSAIRSRQGLVCVGYRWPSEPMGKPWRGSWNALPTLPTWILYFGAAVFLLSFPLFYLVSETRQWWFDQLHYIWNSGSVHIITLLGWTVAGLVLTAVLLRAIVYFRDNYRATNYGVPDLIQIIRAVDGEILKLRRERGEADRRDVQLSFIGHSMGGFVVTNTIRTLSDVFTVPVETLSDYGARARPGVTQDSPPLDEIGNVFRLKRFVLASPDIPAETLLSSRSNFLASALSRFEEAYLFSNEGDEVLRQISTLANYFVFPTKSRNHGFRLGNVEILSSNFGLIDVREDDFLRVLRIGNLTLQDLYAALEGASASRNPNASVPSPAQAPLPRVFTYFDCTDYVDREKPDQPARPLLTFAKWRKRNDPNAKLRWYSHLYLLFAYVAYGQKPNVHGGYFEGMLSQQLIYRLACLGYEDTVAAYGSERALSQICRQKQVRGLLSPLLALRRNLRSMANTPASQAPAPEIPGADL